MLSQYVGRPHPALRLADDLSDLAQFLPDSKSHVFNAGAPVWGLDWCPIHPDEREGMSRVPRPAHMLSVWDSAFV